MKIITIDAGHGGIDPGATNGNLKEADIVLDLSKRLRNKLEKDYAIVMTRSYDWRPTFLKRARTANIIDSDIFISVHVNSFYNEKVHGAETLYFPGSKLGEKLATLVQNEIINKTSAADRGIKTRRDLYVLRETVMPAILVEPAFISNPDEKELLKEDLFRYDIVEALARGIKNYFK